MRSTKRKCLECASLGRIHFPLYVSHGHQRTVAVRCKACNGTGRVVQREGDPLEQEELDKLYIDIGDEAGGA